MKFIFKVIFACLAGVILITLSLFVSAGPITNSSAPTETGYTLTDIYNLIHNQSAEEGDHSISAPSHPTATTSFSVSQIYAELANLIQRENLETGTTYLGITGDYGNEDTNRPDTEVIPSSLTPSGPEGTVTGYTLNDIWNLTQNITTTGHTFTPPTTPSSSQYSLTALYTILKNLIDPTKVKFGISYLGKNGTLGAPAGLISYWAFDGDATDSAGSNDGTVNGATLTTGVGGVADTAYYFDGSSYISMPSMSISSGGQSSFSIWLKPDSVNSYQTVIYDGLPLYIDHDSVGAGIVSILDSNSAWTDSNSTIGSGVWTHIVGVTDGSYIKIYINGVLDKTQAINGVVWDTDPVFGQHPYGINYTGSMDEVRIYNRVITADEVMDLYNTDSPYISSHWTFDGDATDSAGNNDGTVEGAVMASGVGGSPNTAYYFDGVDDYITVGDTGMANGWNALSISTWVYMSELCADTCGLVAERESSDMATGLYQDASIWNNIPYFLVGHDGGYSAVRAESNPLTTARWYHITGTWTSGDYLRLYIDGQLAATSAGPVSATLTQANNNFKFGDDDIGGYSRHLKGKMDDVYIYNRALSAQEVQDMYDADAPATTGLVSYWPLDGDANDAEGNNDMTATGGSTLTTGTKGVADTAYLFDGVTGSSLDATVEANFLGDNNNLTLSVWVKPGATQAVDADIFDAAHAGGGRNFVLQQNSHETNAFYFAFMKGDNNGGQLLDYDGLTKTTQLTADVWQHLVIVKNGTSLDHYLNGVKQGETLTVNEDVYKVATPFRIGNIYDGQGSRPFNGSIDEVRIYNEALTEGQIQDLYTQDAPPAP